MRWFEQPDHAILAWAGTHGLIARKGSYVVVARRLAVALLPAIGFISGPSLTGVVLPRVAAAASQPTGTPAPLPAPHSQVTPCASGWAMVGGPAGSNFPASTLYIYAGTGYIASGPTVADPCHGLWAYFSAPEVVEFPVVAYGTPGSVSQAQCALQAGWNLVGNPFSASAMLPMDVIGYLWNGAGYDRVNVVGIGRAVWIFARSSTSVMLTPM